MKLQRQQRSDFLSMGSDESVVNATIDAASMDIILHNLSNMYSDPYGSIVREYTSNCFDAHKQAGLVDEPVFLGFMEDDDYNEYVYFKDQGIGMDFEFMKNTFMSYGSSTKRDSNEVFGMFGLGSKSALSIRKQFYIDSVKDGVKYEFIIYVGDGNRPQLDVLNEEETDQPNGTTVRIMLENDRHKFISAMENQLIFFRDVIYENVSSDLLNDNYKIIEYGTFRYNSRVVTNFNSYFNNYSSRREGQMCISYDRVRYPINWDELDLDPINLSVGLKFDIGELEVTPSRESIIYGEREIKLIRDRIKGFCYEVINRFNATKTTVHDSYKEYKKNIYDYKLPFCNLDINVNELDEYLEEHYGYTKHHINFHKYTEFERIGINHGHLFNFNRIFKYVVTMTNVIKGGRNYTSDKAIGRGEIIDALFDLDKSYSEKNLTNTYRIMPRLSLDPEKNRTIDEGFIIRPKTSAKSKIALLEHVRKNVNHHKFSDLKFARELYLLALKHVMEVTKKYDDVEGTTVEKKIATGDIKFTRLDRYTIADGKEEINGDELQKYFSDAKQSFVIAGPDEKELVYLYTCIEHFSYTHYKNDGRYSRGYRPITFCFTTKKHKEYITTRGFKNVMTVTEFNNTDSFKNIVTAIFIEEKIDNFKRYFGEIDSYSPDSYSIYAPLLNLISFINRDISNSLVEVLQFYKKWRLVTSQPLYKTETGKLFKEGLRDLIDQDTMINLHIVNLVKEFNAFMDNMEIILYLDQEKIRNMLNNNDEDMTLHIITSIKKLGKRLNPKHYNILNDTWEISLMRESYEKKQYLRELKQYKLKVAS